MMGMTFTAGVAFMMTQASPWGPPGPEDFAGKISREALERALSQSITMMDLLTGAGDVDDNIRMLKEIGVRFAGRTIYLWGGESQLPQKLETGRKIEQKIHSVMPEMFLQAGLFEIVTEQVNQIPVPDWVFREFDLEPQTRTFNYQAMLFPEGRFRDHWAQGCSVPDMSQLETRMWFFFLAASYIDIGIEALHMGQVALIGATDQGWEQWWDVLGRIRRYAMKNARRHLVLCDAHTPDGGPRYEGERLLFDFHSFPLRIEEVDAKPFEGVLKVGYLDSLFGRSRGGITPSGWRCERLPFLVELDNFGTSGQEGQNIGAHWCWGWDEISWFAHQPEAYRNDWLRYAWDWVRKHDPNAFLQMPGSRCVAAPVAGKGDWYFANRPSPAVPAGFNQEDTIKAIWVEADVHETGTR